jgi:sirohydrochlorin cobaltochelatase
MTDNITQLQSASPVILLVAFGASVPSTQSTYDRIEARVRAEFPQAPVLWAYTSQVVRRRLAQAGKIFDSPEIALAKLMDAGVKSVAVQALHILPGKEFHDLYKNCQVFGGMAGGFLSVKVGNPLLASDADLLKVIAALITNLPAERQPDEAVIFVGHGTKHPSNALYTAMIYHLQRRDANLYLGVIAGSPSPEEIKAMLLARKIDKVYLLPFLAVAGGHAHTDIAGKDASSWKSILTKEGIDCVPILKGLADYDNLLDIWISHLQEVYY